MAVPDCMVLCMLHALCVVPMLCTRDARPHGPKVLALENPHLSQLHSRESTEEVGLVQFHSQQYNKHADLGQQLMLTAWPGFDAERALAHAPKHFRTLTTCFC